MMIEHLIYVFIEVTQFIMIFAAIHLANKKPKITTKTIVKEINDLQLSK